MTTKPLDPKQVRLVAENTRRWVLSPDGQAEQGRISAKYGYSDGWFLSYAAMKVHPTLRRFEDIAAVVEEIRIMRRAEAVSRRRA